MKVNNYRFFASLLAIFFIMVSGHADGTGFLISVPSTMYHPSDFMVYQTIELGDREALQILQDKRVTPGYRKSWGASADPGFALGPSDPLLKEFAAHPVQNGRIRLIDRAGHVIDERAFEVPLGEIRKTYLYGTAFPTYLLSVDYGIGMGSYAGPATTFIEISGARIAQIPIVLGSSLKNDWKIVPAAHGSGKDIEQVQCHPDGNGKDFLVDYSTYKFSDGKWRKTSVEKPGFWEADTPFPPRSSFP